MPDQAFSKISSMAGPELPARHQTLSDFLRLTITLPVDRRGMISAAEANTEIFAHCLLFVEANGADITAWHEHIDNDRFRDIALTLGNRCVKEESNVLHPIWQRPRLAQLVTGALARHLQLADEQIYRLELLASLLTVGHQILGAVDVAQFPRHRLLQEEQRQFGQTGSQAGAQWLATRGFAQADTDVLQYQYEDINQLVDASDDIVIVSLAGRIADAMLTDFVLADQYIEVIEKRFGLNANLLSHLFESAYIALRSHNDKTLAQTDFEVLLAEANLAQQFSACSNEAALLELAASCFGCRAIAFGVADDNKLVFTYGDEMFNLAIASNQSLLAQAFRTQTVFSAEENTLVAILDKQLMTRMAADVLWVLPIANAGVIVCGTDTSKSFASASEFLIAAFKAACAALLNKPVAEANEMIEVNRVQAQVRELTHEVNNPLAIVQNYLKTLSLRLGTQDAAQADIKTISDEMLRIGQIIQRYAHIGSEVESLAQPVSLNKVIENLAGIVQGSAINTTIETDLDDSLLPMHLAEGALKQVLLNLMKNAIEAMHDQAGELTIRTRGQINVGGTQYTEILLEDNGPGIPGHIYENLFTANNSSKGQGHTGIGLSVANRLVADMAGLISCRTSTMGTQFQILLPMQN